MEKPVKPVSPDYRDYKDKEKVSNPLKSPFVLALDQYGKALDKYEADVELYEQLKMIRFIKVANPRLIVEKFKINKR